MILHCLIGLICFSKFSYVKCYQMRIISRYFSIYLSFYLSCGMHMILIMHVIVSFLVDWHRYYGYLVSQSIYNGYAIPVDYQHCILLCDVVELVVD